MSLLPTVVGDGECVSEGCWYVPAAFPTQSKRQEESRKPSQTAPISQAPLRLFGRSMIRVSWLPWCVNLKCPSSKGHDIYEVMAPTIRWACRSLVQAWRGSSVPSHERGETKKGHGSTEPCLWVKKLWVVRIFAVRHKKDGKFANLCSVVKSGTSFRKLVK